MGKQEFINKLNYYNKLYDEGYPIISDKEYDDLYFLLKNWKDEVADDDPTQTINYQVVNELKKVEHNHLMLSLDKTKSIDEVREFIGDQPYVAMAKMDGLTCSLKYADGQLVSAETRGNGRIGEDITHNAMVIPSIPKTIDLKCEVIVDGEIICTYNDFEGFKNEYANPRNFAAGSIRLLDSAECAHRNLTFIAWDCIKGLNFNNFKLRLINLKQLGFEIVPFVNKNIEDDIEYLKKVPELYSYPIDGVVFKFANVEYGASLGNTDHHFKNAIAFKFYDEGYTSYLRKIEWTMGRTGVLTPIAIFDPVQIEGSIVERASLHNVSILKNTLNSIGWEGQQVEVAKMNMIIPQIINAEEDDNLIKNYFSTPTICPICGQPLSIVTSDSGTEILICSNNKCEGKLINQFDHFCSKKGLDIKGLSTATLEFLIDKGWLNSLSDIYNLSAHKTEWEQCAGFGKISVNKILDAIELSKSCTLDKFIAALGIPLIGSAVAKDLCEVILSYNDLRKKIDDNFDFTQLDGFAQAKDSAIKNFDYTEADKIYPYLNIEESAIIIDSDVTLQDLVFVITGSVHHWKNRQQLANFIESYGGKVSSSISSKTSFLINNDITSSSAKNMKAKELGIPILSEKDFMELFDFQ